MTDERAGQILQQALAPEIPDEALNRNLKRKMEEKGMKHNKAKRFSIKKAVVLAAACCMVAGTVGVASSGKIDTLVSGFYYHAFNRFDQLPEAESKAGFDIKAVETFQNGYTFSEMSVDDTKGLDENGNVLEQYKQININYEKAGENKLYFHALEEVYARVSQDRVPAKTVGINGIEVKYYVDTYKWVPVGYELTAEDEENLKRSDYFISEGADEISENQISHAIWCQGGIWYSIDSLEEAVPADLLFSMAEEIINL